MVRVTIDVEHDSGLTDATFARSIKDQLQGYDSVQVRPNDVRTICDSVTFHRGWGSSGRKLEIIPETCELCGAQEILRHTDVSPEESDQVEEKCLRPNCPDYHDGIWDHMF